MSMLPTHRPPTHPGEMLLKEFLEPLGVSQVEAARRMNIPFQRLNAIVRGRGSVSADTALLFEALTRWDAQIWLTLQASGICGMRSEPGGSGPRSSRYREPREAVVKILYRRMVMHPPSGVKTLDHRREAFCATSTRGCSACILRRHPLDQTSRRPHSLPVSWRESKP
jgi:addiction module HigA family antidote